jgi:hypothetical protein
VTGPTGPGGIGGPAATVRITTGTTNTLGSLTNVRTTVVWVSGTAGNKTQAIPSASGFDGYLITIKMNPGVTGQLTISAATGTIDNSANYPIFAPQSVTLIADGSINNWMLT